MGVFACKSISGINRVLQHSQVGVQRRLLSQKSSEIGKTCHPLFPICVIAASIAAYRSTLTCTPPPDLYQEIPTSGDPCYKSVRTKRVKYSLSEHGFHMEFGVWGLEFGVESLGSMVPVQWFKI